MSELRASMTATARAIGEAEDAGIPPALAKGRILIVDADATTAATLAAVLRASGYRASETGDRVIARTLLRSHHFDLVLLAIEPEEASVDELRAFVRACLPEASVVVIAGYAALGTALLALRAGVYDYLMKPVDVGELRHLVERVLDRQRLQAELGARIQALEAAHEEAAAGEARLRQEIDDATSTLRQRISDLEQRNAELQRLNEQHDQFIAMVAHEMRGPLNPIINYAQLAQRPSAKHDDTMRYMDLIQEHAFRLNRMIDDLRTATRLSTGQFALQRAECDIARVATEVVDQFATTVAERQFRCVVPAEPVLAEVDADRLVQALRNLLDNAVKYSTEGGAIEVEVSATAREVAISVGDYGAGVTPEDMARIFDAFTRGEHSTDTAGSGLGLYITRGIAEAHGGRLDVRNRTGEFRLQGAIFTLTLPRVAPTAQAAK